MVCVVLRDEPLVGVVGAMQMPTTQVRGGEKGGKGVGQGGEGERQ